MGRFCPHDFHQTTETDLQHMALGGEDYEYAVWEATLRPLSRIDRDLSERQRAQKIVTDKAHALAEQRGLVPYSSATFEALMDEVETDMQKGSA